MAFRSPKFNEPRQNSTFHNTNNNNPKLERRHTRTCIKQPADQNDILLASPTAIRRLLVSWLCGVKGAISDVPQRRLILSLLGFTPALTPFSSPSLAGSFVKFTPELAYLIFRHETPPTRPRQASPSSCGSLISSAGAYLKSQKAGFLAQQRLARGLLLNQTEAIALIASQLQERIRDGQSSVAELMQYGKTMLGWRHVLPGVPNLVHQIQVEGTFPDG
jgi:urease gamma subunit